MVWNRILSNTNSYYNWLLSKKDCEDLAEDIMGAIKEEKYSIILMFKNN